MTYKSAYIASPDYGFYGLFCPHCWTEVAEIKDDVELSELLNAWVAHKGVCGSIVREACEYCTYKIIGPARHRESSRERMKDHIEKCLAERIKWIEKGR